MTVLPIRGLRYDNSVVKMRILSISSGLLDQMKYIILKNMRGILFRIGELAPP